MQVYKGAGPDGIIGAASEGVFSSKWAPAAQDFLLKWEVSSISELIIVSSNLIFLIVDLRQT